MLKTRRIMLAATTAFGALCAADSAGAAMIFTDASAFDAALQRVHIEAFDALQIGAAPTALAFDGQVTVTVQTSGALEDLIVLGSDGHGAVAADGGGFWKLRGGSATLTLAGAPVNAFGFHYSDLENAKLMLSGMGYVFEPMELTDSNASVNHFIGVIADAPITGLTLSWQTAQGDGIGIDQMRFGYAVPAPRSVTLGLAGLGVFSVGRRRMH